MPVTLLIIATGATSGPVLGFFYALCGSVVSAMVHYGLGRIAGKETVRRIAGSRLGHVQRQISRHGFISLLFARIVPIAPFAIVNLVAGAIQIRVRDFLLGTLAGMSPGILAVVVLENQLQRALQDPGIGNITLLMVLASVLCGPGGGVLPLVWDQAFARIKLRIVRQKNFAYCSFLQHSPMRRHRW